MEGDSYLHWGRAWQAFGSGRLADARREAEAAVAATAYFMPIALPLAARAAQWEGDVDAAREIVATASDAELFLYPGDQHYFADSSLPSYDAEATALLTERVLGFLARV